MLLKSIRLKNIATHKNTYIQFWNGLSVIIAPNGTGKTFLLEAIPAALYNSFPSRPGYLYDYVSGDKGEILCEFIDEENGKNLKVHRIIYARGNKHQELFLYLNDNLIADRTRENFLPMVESIFGKEDLFLSSVFSSQNNVGDICNAKAAIRREILGQLLNFGKFDEISQKAKNKYNHVFAQLNSVKEELAKIESELQFINDLENERAKNIEEQKSLQAQIDSMQKDLENVNKQIHEFEVYEASRSECINKLQALQVNILEMEKNRDALLKQIAHDELFVAEKESCEVAQKELHKVEQELILYDELRKQYENWLSAQKEIKFYVCQIENLRNEKSKYNEILKDEVKIKEDAEVWEHLQCWKKKYDNDLMAIQLIELNNKNLSDKIHSIEQLIADYDKRAKLVEEVPCKGQYECELLIDARKARLRIAELTNEKNNLLAQIQPIPQVDDSELERYKIYAQLNVYDKVKELEIAKAKIVEIEEQIKSYDNIIYLCRSENLKPEYDEDSHNKLSKRLDVLKSLVAQLPEIARAETRLHNNKLLVEGFDNMIADAKKQANELQEQISVQHDMNIQDLQNQKSRIENSLKTFQDAIKNIIQRFGWLEGELTRLYGLQKEMPVKKNEVDILQDRSNALMLLSEAFGRKGVQPLLIEHARPQLESIAGNLLEKMTDGLLSIKISTQGSTKSGEVRETMDILVNDGVHERDVATFSGGEQKILRMIMRLTLAIFQSQRSGKALKFLFIDEAFDALDESNALRMVKLLTALRDYFKQIICITHTNLLVNEADDVIKFMKINNEAYRISE